mgnify:CR=1 FL=1
MTVVQKFIELVEPKKLKIIDTPKVVWLFGSGGDEIANIDAAETSSMRAGFWRWLFKNINSEQRSVFHVPENYPNWNSIDSGYTNLVDFELDLTAISSMVIIFSESAGSLAEIGLFATQESLFEQLIFVAEQKYIAEESFGTSRVVPSFLSLGPFKKIKDFVAEIKDENPIFSFSIEDKDSHFSELFSLVAAKLQTSSNQVFDIDNRRHQLLLILDLIHILGKCTRKDILACLEHFSIGMKRSDLERVLKLLNLIDLVHLKPQGNNVFYEIKKPQEHKHLVDFTGAGGTRFNRGDFKISLVQRS